jgi:hypothetical protein
MYQLGSPTYFLHFLFYRVVLYAAQVLLRIRVEQHKNIIQMLLLYYNMHPILATKTQLSTLL